MCSDCIARYLSLSNPILILIPILACEKSYFSHALSSYVLFLSQTRNILYYIIQSKYTFSFSFVHYKKLPNDIITIIGSFSPTHSFSLYTCLSYLTTTFIFCAHPFVAYTYIEQDPFPFAVILPFLDTTATLLSDVAYRNSDI